MYRAFLITLYYEQQVHNYFTKCDTPTYFDALLSSSDSLFLNFRRVLNVNYSLLGNSPASEF